MTQMSCSGSKEKLSNLLWFHCYSQRSEEKQLIDQMRCSLHSAVTEGLPDTRKFIPLVTLAHPPPPPQPENGYSMTNTLTTAAQSGWECGLSYTPNQLYTMQLQLQELYQSKSYRWRYSLISVTQSQQMGFKCTWDSRNPRTSSPGRSFIQPGDHIDSIHSQGSSCPKPSLIVKLETLQITFSSLLPRNGLFWDLILL